MNLILLTKYRTHDLSQEALDRMERNLKEQKEKYIVPESYYKQAEDYNSFYRNYINNYQLIPVTKQLKYCNKCKKGEINL